MEGYPVRDFETEENAHLYLDYWMQMLFLTDWIVHLKYHDFNEAPLNGANMGYCDADYVNQCAVIHLAYPKTIPENCMTICDEHNLVHELLHLRYPVVTDHTYEGEVVARITHADLEKMAKSLLMVKYNITLDWFNHKM